MKEKKLEKMEDDDRKEKQTLEAARIHLCLIRLCTMSSY